MAIRQYVGARYVLKIYENSQNPQSADWEANTSYEPLTMVTYNNSSYISRKEIPATIGNPVDNPTYWALSGFYNGQISALDTRISHLETLDIVFTPEMFGAVGDGVTDDTAAIQDAINSGACILADKSYKITDTLLVNVNTSSLNGLGGCSKIVCDFATNKPAILFHGNNSDDMYNRPVKSRKHGNFAIIGDNNRTPNGIQIADVVGGTYEGEFSNNIFENIIFHNVDHAINLGAHVFDCLFVAMNSNIANYSLYTLDNTDTGEDITFLKSSFGNGRLYTTDTIQFIACTFHFMEGASTQTVDSLPVHLAVLNNCKFTNCHFERLTFTDDATDCGVGIYIKGQVDFTACEFVIDGHTRTAQSAIYVADTPANTILSYCANLVNCDISTLFNLNTTYTTYALKGNVRSVNSCARAAGNTTQLPRIPISDSMTKCDAHTAEVTYNTSDYAISSITDNSDGTQDVTITTTNYVSSISMKMKWKLPVADHSALAIIYDNSTSDGVLRFSTIATDPETLKTITFYDGCGNLISNNFNLNDDVASVSGTMNRFFAIPNNAVYVSVGIVFQSGATGSGASKSFKIKSHFQLI